MQIILKDAADGGETVLCDGATRELDKSSGPEGISAPMELVTQVRAFVRGASAKPTNRGNAKVAITFAVTRRCADQAAAVEWLLSHLANCKVKDTLILASGATRWTVPDVSLDKIDHRPPTDATVRVTYTLSGGRPTTS